MSVSLTFILTGCSSHHPHRHSNGLQLSQKLFFHARLAVTVHVEIILRTSVVDGRSRLNVRQVHSELLQRESVFVLDRYYTTFVQ